ncbi:MAG: OmpA family protein [Deltaproteobacteria bacterium]|nr:OmpA family protein [Deltaproteobacteria bacterium]
MHRSVLAISLCLAACGATTAAVPDDLDLDGILDARDECPRVPEELDGFEDDDGCPDPDNDGDGIVDIADLCPCDDEDRDEWEDADGCPDPDNDADRLHDACDLCPDEPETYNGICDEDGCPDRSGICVEEARVAIVETIAFSPSSVRIDPSVQPIVQALASTLNGNPQLERIALVGHATTRERRAATLSLRRAEAVRDAIIALGVARERLEVRGEAPTAPITGDPREGRFVSFVLLRVSGEDWTAGEPPPRPGRGCGARACDPVPACTPPAPAPSDC